MLRFAERFQAGLNPLMVKAAQQSLRSRGLIACGMIALRPDRDGRIHGYEGAERVFDKFGEWIVASHLPPPGTPTQPVEAGYMANAWIRIRHPDYDYLRAMMNTIGETLKVRAS